MNASGSRMKNFINLYALAVTLLFGISVFTEAKASETVYKCIIAGRVVYSNVTSDCAHAVKKAALAHVAVDPYPLDLGVRVAQGAAAHAYLRGMSTQIPHYANVPDYSDIPDIVVPDLSRPEYSGNGGYSGGRQFDDYGAVRSGLNR